MQRAGAPQQAHAPGRRAGSEQRARGRRRRRAACRAAPPPPTPSTPRRRWGRPTPPADAPTRQQAATQGAIRAHRPQYAFRACSVTRSGGGARGAMPRRRCAACACVTWRRATRLVVQLARFRQRAAARLRQHRLPRLQVIRHAGQLGAGALQPRRGDAHRLHASVGVSACCKRPPHVPRNASPRMRGACAAAAATRTCSSTVARRAGGAEGGAGGGGALAKVAKRQACSKCTAARAAQLHAPCAAVAARLRLVAARGGRSRRGVHLTAWRICRRQLACLLPSAAVGRRLARIARAGRGRRF